jgi:hypothetical protein
MIVGVQIAALPISESRRSMILECSNVLLKSRSRMLHLQKYHRYVCHGKFVGTRVKSVISVVYLATHESVALAGVNKAKKMNPKH